MNGLRALVEDEVGPVEGSKECSTDCMSRNGDKRTPEDILQFCAHCSLKKTS